MTALADGVEETTDAFKALGDPVRWTIVQAIGATDELPCSRLEHMLPISRPTISYHVKILVQAGLVAVRKQGRSYHYSLRHDVLADLTDQLWSLAPAPRSVGPSGELAPRRQPKRRRAASEVAAAEAHAENGSLALLTW
jgi:DNA-binding transcriptional ArsR family regulator